MIDGKDLFNNTEKYIENAKKDNKLTIKEIVNIFKEAENIIKDLK